MGLWTLCGVSFLRKLGCLGGDECEGSGKDESDEYLLCIRSAEEGAFAIPTPGPAMFESGSWGLTLVQLHAGLYGRDAMLVYER